MATETAELDLDMEEWEIGDLEDFMAASGRTMANVLMASSEPSMADIRAFFWITRRRKDPAYTFDDTRHVKLSELNEAFGAVRPNAPAAPAASQNGSHASRASTRGARRKPTGG